MHVLTINSGSSSIKFGLYQVEESETRILTGSLERIGLQAGIFRIAKADDTHLVDEHLQLRDHKDALDTLFAWLEENEPENVLDAVGHRVVHGGPSYARPHLVTPTLVDNLRNLTHLAPNHLPHEIKAIQATSSTYPDLPQVACFDTAFHRSMPILAQIYGLPRHYQHEGIMRYGFHGLSYEYILQELRKDAGQEAAEGRVVIAHLGNGASMAAVSGGRSVDTTMGLTPAGGLVMSTRSGDLDPGVPIYLMEEKGLEPSGLNELVNRQAGLLGVSGTTSDMKDLLAQEDQDPHARQAVDLFCYQAKKSLGALVAVLGGLDTLIFTGGIGENAPEVRQRICHGLSYMGIQLDKQANDKNAPLVSQQDSPVIVRVMATDEDLMIARHTYDQINQDGRKDES